MNSYISKDVFAYYYQLLLFGDNQTIIVALQEIYNLLERNQFLLPGDKQRLDKFLKKLLESTTDDAIRRCAYRLCSISYCPELCKICQHLLVQEKNLDNKMSIIPVIYKMNTLENFHLIMGKIDCGLSDTQITLAKCFFPRERVKYLDKKIIKRVLDTNDITSLRWLPIIYNSQNLNALHKNEFLNSDLFSELLKNEDVWVQKYAMGTFHLQKNFHVSDIKLDYNIFLDLDAQPKKWALANIWYDYKFIIQHLDFIEEVLSLENLFVKCDYRVRIGIAKGLSQFSYNDKIASLVIAWFSYEKEEAVSLWLKIYMMKFRNNNKEFEYALEQESVNSYTENSRKNILIPADIIGKTERKVKTMINKITKIFISHSSSDKCYAEALVNLLEDIGVRKASLFCSSVVGYGIPLDEDIYTFLKEQFSKYNLHVFFLLSSNYYKSVACLNEMGAAWITQSKYTTFLLPSFQFKEIEGAINPRQIAIKFDSDKDELKEKIGELKDDIVSELELTCTDGVRWEKKRDDFLKKIKTISNQKIIHS